MNTANTKGVARLLVPDVILLVALGLLIAISPILFIMVSLRLLMPGMQYDSHTQSFCRFSLVYPGLLFVAMVAVSVLVYIYNIRAVAHGVGWIAIAAVLVCAGVLIDRMSTTNYLELDDFGSPDRQEIIRACIGGDVDAVEAYIAAGNRIDFAGKRGLNPLYVAYESRQMDVFRVLVEAATDLNSVPAGKEGYYVPLVIMQRNVQGTGECEGERYLRLLLEAGLRANNVILKRPMLLYAIESGCVTYVSVLQEYGAEMRLVDVDGRSTLEVAVSCMHWEIAIKLLPFAALDDIARVKRMVKGLDLGRVGGDQIAELIRMLDQQ